MKQIFRGFWLVGGAISTLDALLAAIFVRFNLALAFTLLAGGLALLYGLYYDQIQRWSARGGRRTLRLVFYAAYAILISVTGFIAVYGQLDTVDYQEDAVIIPGAGLKGHHVSLMLAQRLDAALDYHAQNPDALLVVSGGQGADEVISEAEAMARYLESHGVPGDLILLENKATSTYENFMNSKALLDRELGEHYRITLITNGCHVYRSSLMAQEAGLESTHLHSATVLWLIPSSYMWEFLGALHYWVFGVS